MISSSLFAHQRLVRLHQPARRTMVPQVALMGSVLAVGLTLLALSPCLINPCY